MKAKENAKSDDINLQANTLTDLPVANEQADKVGGGSSPLLYTPITKN